MVHTNPRTKKLLRLLTTNKKRNKLDKEKKKKLHLVLDLDHTLVHKIDVLFLTQKEKYLLEEVDSRKDLWRFNKDNLYNDCIIKLRPFVREFLKKANKLFSMHLYTKGSYVYAKDVLSVIDPRKICFGDRVITKKESPYEKTLDFLDVDQRKVVIVDDKSHVWPIHKRNLLQITKYMYFRGYYYNLKSYAEEKRDESRRKGSLVKVLKFLKNVHKRFKEELDDCNDVRLLIRNDPCSQILLF